MNKLKIITGLTLLLFTLTACEKTPVPEPEPLTYTVPQSDIDICEYESAEYTDDEIEIMEITTSTSDIFGDTDKFTNPCKDTTANPIVFANPQLKSFFFEISLDAIYPIDNLVITNFLSDPEMAIKELDISISLDGNSYTKLEDNHPLSNTGNKETVIDLTNVMAKHIKFSFSSTKNEGNYGSDFFGINDISLFLGEGYIVKEADDWDEALTRYDGWTGADGIFSFNLEDGNDSIGTDTSSTLFLFSDTILGNVNPDTFLRLNPEFLNNSIGYYNGDSSDIFNNMEFEWLEKDGEPANIFEPTNYVGYHPSNLNNQIGLTQLSSLAFTYDYEVSGSSWISNDSDTDPYVVFDVLESTDLTKLEIFNFVENLDFSTTELEISYSNDNVDYTVFGSYNLSVPTTTNALLSSMFGTEYSLDLTGVNARYIRIDLLDNNSTSTNQVGLSKVLLYSGDKVLYSKVTASSYDDSNQEVDEHPRLWLQDGVVIGDYFYTFPLLVKDTETFFKVFKVGLVKIHIVDDKLDLNSIEYMDTPLQHAMNDGSVMYFGAGVNNMDTSGGLVNQDGYIYVYGYKDLQGGRFLTVARVEEENFENFNKWTFFDGSGWSEDINDTFIMVNSVSPELSVTYLDSGIHAGKYMLVVMKNSTSGSIAVSYSDNPYGPWSGLETVYLTSKIRELPGGFAYNAKMHPHLSEDGKYLISYNVNTTGLSVMSNGEIYHPRFIWLIETKNR